MTEFVAYFVAVALLQPDSFIAQVDALGDTDIENIQRNANGSYSVRYQGQNYLIIAPLDSQLETITAGSQIDPQLTLANSQAPLRYSVPYSQRSNQGLRRSRNHARQVLIFEPQIEALPADLCFELGAGEWQCETPF